MKDILVKPLNQLGIAELGLVGSNIILTADEVRKNNAGLRYFGDYTRHESFAAVPGGQENKGEAVVSGFVPLVTAYHRLLRNMGVVVASLLDTEKLGEVAAEVKWLHTAATGELAAHLKPHAGRPPQAPTPDFEVFNKTLSVNSVKVIPLKIKTGKGDFLTVDIPNRDLFVDFNIDHASNTASILSFLAGIKMFAKVGGTSSKVYSEGLRSVVMQTVGAKNASALTDSMGEIAELTLAAAGKKYGEATAAAVEQTYFRFSPKDCEKIQNAVGASERELQLLYLSHDVFSNKSKDHDVQKWLLKQGGKTPDADFKPQSFLELAVALSRLREKGEQYDPYLTSRHFGIDFYDDGYFSVPTARRRVELISGAMAAHGNFPEMIERLGADEGYLHEVNLITHAGRAVRDGLYDVSKIKRLLEGYFTQTPEQMLAAELAEVKERMTGRKR